MKPSLLEETSQSIQSMKQSSYRLRLLWRSALTLVVVAMLSACGKKSEPNNPTPPPPAPKQYTQADEQSTKGLREITPSDTVIMHSNVVDVQEDINDFLDTAASTDGKLVYHETPALQQVRVGDVLYSSGADKGTRAYAYKVKSIHKVNGKIEYEVEQAQLGEIFEQYSVKTNYDMNPNSIEFFDIDEQLDGNVPLRSFKSDLLKRAKAELKDGKLKIEYILVDLDDDYEKTTDDQITLGFSSELHMSPIDVSFKYFTFSLKSGLTLDKPTISLSYGMEYYKMKDAEGKTRNVANFFKESMGWSTAEGAGIKGHRSWTSKIAKMSGKRIRLYRTSFTSTSPTRLAVDPVFEFYAILSFDVSGKLQVSIEAEPLMLDFTYMQGATVPPLLTMESRGLSGLENVSVLGDAKASLKMGLGVGLVLYFPALTKGLKRDDQSRLGIYGDIALGVTGSFSSELKYAPELASPSDPGLSGSVQMGLEASLDLTGTIEGKLYLWKVKESTFEQEIFKKRLIGPWNCDFSYIWLNQGDTHKVKLYDAAPDAVRVSGEDEFVSGHHKGENYIFTAQKPGYSVIDLVAPRRRGKYAFFVSPTRAVQGSSGIEVSPGERL